MSSTSGHSRLPGRSMPSSAHLRLAPPSPPPPPPPPPPPHIDRVPMVYRIDSWDHVDPQDSSVLFSGRIPAEIRRLIFEFVLTEDVGPGYDHPVHDDFCCRHGHGKLDDVPVPVPAAEDSQNDETELESSNNVEAGVAAAVRMPPASSLNPRLPGWDWMRPGYTGPRRVHTALLQTCRRIYIEANGLPSLAAKKVFYSKCAPSFCPKDPRQYISRLHPAAARQIRHIQIFSSAAWLEGMFFEMVTTLHTLLKFNTALMIIFPAPLPPLIPYPYAYLPSERALQSRSPSSPIRPWRVTEHLTTLGITMRRSDWDNWDTNGPLAVNPFREIPEDATPEQVMQENMQASLQADRDLSPQQRHSSPTRIERWWCWGLLFLQMVNLKTLTINFETTEDKREEMEAIVRWAHQSWRFPVLQRLSGDSSDPFTEDQLRAHHTERPVDLTQWLPDIRVLTAEDKQVKRSSWRGTPTHFACECPSCLATWHRGDFTTGCERCDERKSLKAVNKGPQLLVWTVTWTLKTPQGNSSPWAAASNPTGVIGEGDNGEGSGNQPPNAANAGQGGGRPERPNTESDVLAMLPPDAQYRSRREREIEEIVNSEVCF